MDSTTANFAQRLAGNEKKTRDRAIGRLRKYLSLKGGLSQADLMKLWKGLHYCLWMQDKPLLQEQLVARIVGLMDCQPDQSQGLLFLQTCLLTQGREWNKIDLWRLDKFMMLVRQMMRRGLELVCKNGWTADSLKQWNALLAHVLVQEEDVADGLRFHITDIYLDEVAKVGGRDLSEETILTLLQPFQQLVCRGKNKVLVRRVLTNVLQPLCRDLPGVEMGDDVPESLVPNLQVSTASLTQLLMGWGGLKSSRNRALIFSLVRRMRDAEAGLVRGQQEEDEGVDMTERDVDRACQSLQAFHHSLIQAKLRHQEKKKQMKKNKKKMVEEEEEDEDGFEEEMEELAEEAGQAEEGSVEGEEETEEITEESGDDVVTEPSRKKQKKDKKKARKAAENGDSDSQAKLQLREKKKEKKKKQKQKKIKLEEMDEDGLAEENEELAEENEELAEENEELAEETDDADEGTVEGEGETEETTEELKDTSLTETHGKKRKRNKKKKAKKVPENGQGPTGTNTSLEVAPTSAAMDAVESTTAGDETDGKSPSATPAGKKGKKKKRKMSSGDAPESKRSRTSESSIPHTDMADQTSKETSVSVESTKVQTSSKSSTPSVEFVSAKTGGDTSHGDREKSSSVASWSDELEPGEVEIFVPSKKYAAKLKAKQEQQQEQKQQQKKKGQKQKGKKSDSGEESPAGNAKSPGATIFGPLTPVVSPQGTAMRLSRSKASQKAASSGTASVTPASEKKKVNFNLSQNLSIAFHSADAASPQPFTPAFSPSRQPQGSILKPSPPTTRSAARRKAAAKQGGKPKTPSPAAAQGRTGTERKRKASDAQTPAGKTTVAAGSGGKKGGRRVSEARMTAADFF